MTDMTTETLTKWRRQILAILNTVELELKARGQLDITSKELREMIRARKNRQEVDKELT